MDRIAPLKPEELGELQDIFEPVIERMGFIPKSQLVMARKPALLKAFIQLGRAVYAEEEGSIPFSLKNMIGHASSLAVGCMYCAAHTGSNASRSGVADDKIAAIWEYETNDVFSKAERAALRFAQAASSVPNAVTDDDVAELAKHYTEFQIVEIMSVVAMFGYLNRWNDSLATGLEDVPTNFAEQALAETDWQPGKHVEAAE